MPTALHTRLVDLLAKHPDRVARALDFVRDERDLELPSAPPELEPLLGSGVGSVGAVAYLEPEHPGDVPLWLEWGLSAREVDDRPVPLAEGLVARLADSSHPSDAAWLARQLPLEEGAPASDPRGCLVGTSDGLGARVPRDLYARQEIRILRSTEAADLARDLHERGRSGSALIVLRKALAMATEGEVGVLHAALVPVLHSLGRHEQAERSAQWAEVPEKEVPEEEPPEPHDLGQALEAGDLAAARHFVERAHRRGADVPRPRHLRAVVAHPADTALPLLRLLTDDGEALGAEHATALRYCASEEAVRFLVEHGIDPNAREAGGQTPLFRARRPELVRWLVQHGADPAAVDNHYRTPLFYVDPAPDPQALARALVEVGVDPWATDDGGDSFRAYLPHDLDLDLGCDRGPSSQQRVIRRRRD